MLNLVKAEPDCWNSVNLTEYLPPLWRGDESEVLQGVNWRFWESSRSSLSPFLSFPSLGRFFCIKSPTISKFQVPTNCGWNWPIRVPSSPQQFSPGHTSRAPLHWCCFSKALQTTLQRITSHHSMDWFCCNKSMKIYWTIGNDRWKTSTYGPSPNFGSDDGHHDVKTQKMYQTWGVNGLVEGKYGGKPTCV
jgi:hypothetical protein